MEILSPSFYERDTILVAHELIGTHLIGTIDGYHVSGLITETEAYKASDDPASHAFRGRTKRNMPMFGPVGYTYIYFIYGNHFCLNLVARDPDADAGAVLIRSIVPEHGVEIMQKRRGGKHDKHMLANGPGKLAQAYGITGDHNGLSAVEKESPVYIMQGSCVDQSCIKTSRIGISKAKDKLWRFYMHQKIE